MSDNFVITNLNGWLNLPNIEMPSLKSEKEKGSVFHVKKVGFVLVDKNECKRKGLNAQQAPGGKCALPTAVVLFGNKYELCSLPLELSEWVQQCVGMAHSGMNAFPTQVEFGVLNNRIYAEML
ncbi:hypothetical protein MNBD_NITROSPIRAE02-1635 [hydrothermal vent metagenome]|uniref:Uncharacterized protein n=1 Tax=hydrothermal vent metagenome TaxID=652676 RepID=A0A3B1DNR7_9ZZZZ